MAAGGTEWLLAWQQLPRAQEIPNLSLHLLHTIAADGHLHRVALATAPLAHSAPKTCQLKPLLKILK